jgi:hypothetical protein
MACGCESLTYKSPQIIPRNRVPSNSIFVFRSHILDIHSNPYVGESDAGEVYWLSEMLKCRDLLLEAGSDPDLSVDLLLEMTQVQRFDI